MARVSSKIVLPQMVLRSTFTDVTGNYDYIIAYAEAKGNVTRVGNRQIHTVPVDTAFTNRFFEHLEEIHNLQTNTTDG